MIRKLRADRGNGSVEEEREMHMVVLNCVYIYHIRDDALMMFSVQNDQMHLLGVPQDHMEPVSHHDCNPPVI